MIRFIAKTAIVAAAAGMLAAGLATPASAAHAAETGESSNLLSSIVGTVDAIAASVLGDDVVKLDKVVGTGD